MNSYNRDVGDQLQWWFVAGSIAVTAIVIILKYLFPSNALGATGDLVSLLLASYVSYAVSSHFAHKSARSELRGLAEATGEHIFLLSSQIRDLANETTEFEPDGDKSRIYLALLRSQMFKLASQAELSFHNTQRLAGLDISIPALRDEVRTTIEEGAKRENLPCPFCKASVEIVLSTSVGATRHAQCAACRKPFSVHRVADGKIRVMFEDVERIECPNTPCTNQITVKRRSNEWGTLVRNCYECFARIRYNVDSKTIEGFEIEKPLTVEVSKLIDSKGPCPYCGYLVTFKGTKNSRAETVQFCPNCTKLMLAAAAA